MTPQAQASLRPSSQAADSVRDHGRPRLFRLKRTALAAGVALVSINVSTGAPLVALWVGSRFEGWAGGSGPGGGTTMRAVFVLMVVLALVELLLTFVLTRL